MDVVIPPPTAVAPTASRFPPPLVVPTPLAAAKEKVASAYAAYYAAFNGASMDQRYELAEACSVAIEELAGVLADATEGRADG